MIQLSNITKVFHTAGGVLTAVDNVSVHIEKGEIFAFIGFSGAGKSTLIRCINLLEKPDAGAVIVDNENLLELKKSELLKRRQKVGMIFQHYNLLQNATVFKNISFPLEIAGVPKKQRHERVMQCLETVHLTDKIKDYPVKLSGGQKQRVAIARAIVNEPKILLCDEPTSALDPQTTETILSYLKRINEAFGITIVIVTHEMSVARTICHRVGVMERGCLIETITINGDTEVPQSEFGKILFSGGGGI
ncbi:MAG: ATP-binding cassette domain-containing protein [Planctomycetaceae bacterium]|jgi:D-methionine transport system ATP-binding protein|nr:ATP-binding cassette domain-containing protein [Planctomycetaceae bacterium]